MLVSASERTMHSHPEGSRVHERLGVLHGLLHVAGHRVVLPRQARERAGVRRTARLLYARSQLLRRSLPGERLLRQSPARRELPADRLGVRRRHRLLQRQLSARQPGHSRVRVADASPRRRQLPSGRHAMHAPRRVLHRRLLRERLRRQDPDDRQLRQVRRELPIRERLLQPAVPKGFFGVPLQMTQGW